MTRLRIICARCRRQVDRVVTLEDIASCTLRIAALCHGEREEMRLDQSTCVDADLLREMLEGEGVAFVVPDMPARLPA